MTREEAIREEAIRVLLSDRATYKEMEAAVNIAVRALKEQRPHGEWVSKPKRVQVDETDEERIFETKLEWFCSSCEKSFGCRKPDDAFCKYCGSDNRPRENTSFSMVINGKYSENVEYGTRVERKEGDRNETLAVGN